MCTVCLKEGVQWKRDAMEETHHMSYEACLGTQKWFSVGREKEERNLKMLGLGVCLLTFPDGDEEDIGRTLADYAMNISSG